MIPTIDPEFRSIIPPLAADEMAQLEANIIADGCRDPLVTWGGILIDGHNRLEICQRRNLPFQTSEMEFADRSEAIEWIIRNQFGRRNLPPYQRTKLALRLEKEIAARAKEKQKGGQGGILLSQKSAEANHVETRQEIAKLAGVSRDTVDKVKQIERHGTPEIKDALAKGKISINKAHQTVRLPIIDDDSTTPVVDESKPKRTNIKVKESNGMAIYASAKCVMDRLSRNDSEWSQSLSSMIEYCQKRLSSKK